MGESLLLRFLLFVLVLILNKFKFLFDDSFFLSPSRFTLLEHLLSVFELTFHFRSSGLMLQSKIFMIVLSSLKIFIVLLFQDIMFLLSFSRSCDMSVHLLFHCVLITCRIVFKIFILKLQFSVLVLMLVDLFLHVFNLFNLILNLLLKLLLSFFVLTLKLFLWVSQFSRQIFFSFGEILDFLFQEINLLIKKCFLLIKLRFWRLLSSSNIFLLLFNSVHLFWKFFNLSFVFFLLTLHLRCHWCFKHLFVVFKRN